MPFSDVSNLPPDQAGHKVHLIVFAGMFFFAVFLFGRRGLKYKAKNASGRSRAGSGSTEPVDGVPRRDMRFHVLVCMAALMMGLSNIFAFQNLPTPFPAPWLVVGRMASAVILAGAVCHLGGANFPNTTASAMLAGGAWMTFAVAQTASSTLKHLGFTMLAIALGSGALKLTFITARASQCKLLQDRMSLISDLAALVGLCYSVLWVTSGYLSVVATVWCFGLVDTLFIVGTGHLMLKSRCHRALDAALQHRAGLELKQA